MIACELLTQAGVVFDGRFAEFDARRVERDVAVLRGAHQQDVLEVFHS